MLGKGLDGKVQYLDPSRHDDALGYYATVVLNWIRYAESRELEAAIYDWGVSMVQEMHLLPGSVLALLFLASLFLSAWVVWWQGGHKYFTMRFIRHTWRDVKLVTYYLSCCCIVDACRATWSDEPYTQRRKKKEDHRRRRRLLRERD